MIDKLHEYSEVVALPNRSVIKDARNRLFQIRYFEDGDRQFAMFGSSTMYSLNGEGSVNLMFAYPVTVLWSGQDVRLENDGYEDGNWIH